VLDCCVALGLGGRELLAAAFCQGSGLFRLSLAEAFLYVILGRVELQKRKDLHACPLHTEPLQRWDCAPASRCLRHFAHAVSKDFEPNQEERYPGHPKGCGRTSGRETWCLVVLRDGFVQRTENEVRQIKLKRE
jgi:hypothetical protein